MLVGLFGLAGYGAFAVGLMGHRVCRSESFGVFAQLIPWASSSSAFIKAKAQLIALIIIIILIISLLYHCYNYYCYYLTIVSLS